VSSDSRQYPQRPIVGVGAVILVNAAAPVAGLPSPLPEPFGVVLVKRRFEPLAGHWSLPGGMLEIGETLVAGVAREILEETGLVVEVGAVIEVFDRITLDDEAMSGAGAMDARPEGLHARPEGRAYESTDAGPESTPVGPTFRSGAGAGGQAVRSGSPVRYHYVLIDYLCRPTGGTLRAGSDVSDVAIADPRALAAYGTTPTIESIVSRALEMTR
jgi:8-oxo-dGTP diphosphatase